MFKSMFKKKPKLEDLAEQVKIARRETLKNAKNIGKLQEVTDEMFERLAENHKLKELKK